jgi:hypothetical protein
VLQPVTRASAAAAVSEEKDRHTLPLLLTTQLTDREIVFGKPLMFDSDTPAAVATEQLREAVLAL